MFLLKNMQEKRKDQSLGVKKKKDQEKKVQSIQASSLF